jgi:hypothetical protein
LTPFEFSNFLDLAERLQTSGDEASLRSAISRAYYAIMHVAYQALPTALRAGIANRNTHRDVWQFYSRSSVSVCRQIGHAGIRLRDARVAADYRSIPQVSEAQAERLVVHARDTMTRLQRHGYQP